MWLVSYYRWRRREVACEMRVMECAVGVAVERLEW